MATIDEVGEALEILYHQKQTALSHYLAQETQRKEGLSRGNWLLRLADWLDLKLIATPALNRAHKQSEEVAVALQAYRSRDWASLDAFLERYVSHLALQYVSAWPVPRGLGVVGESSDMLMLPLVPPVLTQWEEYQKVIKEQMSR